MGILLVAAFLAAAFLIGDPATWYVGPRLGVIQTIYQDGAPHTDRQGRRRMEYDPARSFFPIGIYHGLTGEFGGRRYDFSVLRDAGFNTVHAWEGQGLDSVAPAAARNGLQVIHHNPSDAEARRGDPTVLAWYLDEEPSIREWDPEWHARFARFQARRAKLRALDPDRAVFALDGPFVDPPRRERWLAWNAAGDISAHWNYPLKGGANESLAGRRGIPETVTSAVRLNAAQKPVWLVVQAFQSPIRDWRMPEPRELRAMVYAGITHGATGIVYFALDSFVTRDGQVVGVAPWTEAAYGASPDYNRDGKEHLEAAPDTVAESRALWRAIGDLNRELADIAPALLSPTARIGYTVEASRNGAPVRTLLKRRGDQLTLIAVNIEDRPVNLSVRIQHKISDLTIQVGDTGGFRAEAAGWSDILQGFDARVYRFQLAPAS
jgi:hypothetical protein